MYLARIPAWLSAGSKPWSKLSTAGIGRYRYDPDGFVFHHSRGISGNGYAICLHCGYAAGEPKKAGSIDSAELPNGFERHRRLRGGKSDDGGGTLCSGAAGGFGVLRHHQLGADSRTDILELQLSKPGGTAYITELDVACSLAVALREAIARHLNIDVREIGWHVQPGVHPRDGRQSILFFDIAEGGAGYVGTIPDVLPALLDRARGFLSCPRDCDRACHGCLLAFDTADFVEHLNRRAALAYLTDDVILSAGLPPPHRVFGEKTSFEPSPLAVACLLRAQLSGMEEVRLYLDGSGKDASFDPSWPLWPHLIRWRTHTTAVRLVVSAKLLDSLTWQESNALANQLEATGMELWRVADPVLVGGRHLALEIGSRQRSSRWAVSDSAMLCPGEEWGQPTETGNVVRIHVDEPLGACPGQMLAASDIRSPVPGTFVSITVDAQLNGNVSGFGSRLLGQIFKSAPILKARLNGSRPLKSLEYSDRYLRSPLSVRLLAEVLRYLATLSGGINQETNVKIRSTHGARSSEVTSYGLTGNWATDESQRQVTEFVIREVVKGIATVELGRRNSIPHFRFLRFVWPDGDISEIRFDQGLSGMQVAGRVTSFDTTKPAARQAVDLLRLAIHVEPIPPGTAPIYIMQS
jgi:hypothetical protein